MKNEKFTALVTGFPAFTAKRICQKLLLSGDRVYVLVKEKFREDAEIFIQELRDENKDVQAEIFIGDIVSIDLGLSGLEITQLFDDLDAVYHLAAIYYLGESVESTRLVNVEGTRNMLKFASEIKGLKRFNFFSTAFVSGLRQGVILEDELECGQHFRNYYEETKYEAERIVRAAMKSLPVSIFRPSIIVGDSVTGEIDKFDGPYFLMNAIINIPFDIHLPLPGEGNAPLNMVPVDYVVDAACYISKHPNGVGKTFHLTDPNPYPAQKVFQIVAQRGHRKEPKGIIPGSLAKALLMIPGLEKLARNPRQFIDYFNHLAIYNCINSLDILRGISIQCPPFTQYVDNLITYMQSVLATD